MAREDIEIKGEIIGELEDIDDPQTERDLLDALMVERVEVFEGQVTVVLLFGDAYPKEQRWSVEDEVHDAIEAIEGVKDINIQSMTRSAFKAEEAAEEGAEAPEPEAPPEPEAVAEAPPAPEAASDAEAASSGGLSMYSGGGCGAGTVIEPEVRATVPAKAAAKAPAPSAPPQQAPAPVAAPEAAAANAAVVVDAAGNQQVVLSLATYTTLVQAQRELELSPSLDEHTALKAEFRLLQSKVQSLQDAIQALMQT